MSENEVNLIPFYFPQFYRIPENDMWWGEGYTDWDKVKQGYSLNEDHCQPRIPLSGNYYDQSKVETLQWQIELALKHNIHGFNFYHYWFDGRLLLEKPIDIFRNLHHSLKFCITWANETWTKRWDGKYNEILMKQNHTVDEDEWQRHFNYLYGFFEDPRYIRIEGKPVFLIYRPDLIGDLNLMIDFFKMRAIEKGLNGLYFIGIKSYDSNVDWTESLDALLRFQPRDLFASLRSSSKLSRLIEKNLRSLPEKYQILIGELRHKYQGSEKYDYKMFWDALLDNAKIDQSSPKKIFQSVIPDWDNAARYGKRAKYFFNVAPAVFKDGLSKLIEIEKALPGGGKYIFINAWNEWSEGAYLEPDSKNGLAYLEILKEFGCVSN